MLMMVDFVRVITSKKSCMYGKYGLFEHLLFLLSRYCHCCIYFLPSLSHTFLVR